MPRDSAKDKARNGGGASTGVCSAPMLAGIAAEPGLERFTGIYGAGKPQVVWARLVADLETPVSAYMKLAGAGPDRRSMSFLLESVEGGAVRGRYSIIGLEPDLVWRARGNGAQIN